MYGSGPTIPKGRYSESLFSLQSYVIGSGLRLGLGLELGLVLGLTG